MSKQKISSEQLGPVLCLSVAIFLIALSLGCSSSSIPPSTCAGFTGSFTNASLGAAGTQYAYELSGWVKNSSGASVPYSEAGSVTLDGNGNITGGKDDFWGNITGGSYTISSAGTGTFKVNTSNSQTGTQQSLVWAVALANASTTSSAGSFAVMETDAFANSAGAAYQQSASALSTAPAGTFVFRTHATASATSIVGAQDSAGLLTFSDASIAGSEDWVNGGVGSGQLESFSGTFTSPSGGIGTVSFTDGLGARLFDYFVIDASHLLLYETDSVNAGLGLGRAEMQQAPVGGFNKASLSGSFAFGGRGDTSASGAGGVSSVGQFAADGNGNVTGGTLDSVRDGSAQLAQTVAATTYSITAKGRVSMSFSSSGGGGTAIALYLVDPTRGFFLINGDTTLVEDGSTDLQSSASFTNSAFTGQYAFVMSGAVSGVPLDRIGEILADGKGTLSWTEQVNTAGSSNSACLAGTYSASANGRVSASVTSLSSNVIFYLVSPNSAYTLQADTATQMPGAIANQDHQAMPVIAGYF